MSTGVWGNRRLLALVTATAVVAALVTFYGGDPARAASVSPTPVDGTEACAGSEQLTLGSVGDGTFEDGPMAVTVSNFDGQTFDWSATGSVTGVVVSAAEGSHLYGYDTGSTGDTGLAPPGEGTEITQISFCFENDEAEESVEEEESVAAEETVEAQTTVVPTVSVDADCELIWVSGVFLMRGVVDFDVTPDEGIESISITPKPGGDSTIEGATWTGSPVKLHAWSYEWVATVEDGYAGEAPSGEFDLDREWFHQCSCPSGSFDLSSTGVLRANQPGGDSKLGQPASPVTIAAGFYDIYLASFDDHSLRPGQTQPQEIWSLANAEDGEGSFVSPPTGDLPNDHNFKSYHVGSVFVPSFSNDGLWTVHAAAPAGVNSIEPTCARLVKDDREVDVSVSANSCSVDDQGEPVGSIDVSIDPNSAATVEVYSDAGKNDLVAEITGSDTIGDLAPGTYYWVASPDAGYDLSGPSEGQVTIKECTVTVTVVGSCDEEGTREISVEIDPNSAATVAVFNSDGDEVGTLGDGETLSLPGAQTYTWEAIAADGFAISGPDSGTFAPCSEVMALILVTVEGACLLDNGDAIGRISVEISVDGGATVTVTDSDGGPVDTFTESGVVTVAADATYNWEATPNEGFEFPVDFDSTGQVTIEDCSVQDVLPFTGLDSHLLLALALLMFGSGIVIVMSVGRRQSRHGK